MFYLLHHCNYAMDDGVFSSWVYTLPTSSNRFVNKLFFIKHNYVNTDTCCKMLLIGPGPKRVYLGFWVGYN